ncbi:TetR/AcrR family transcriptional regulator [Methylocystis sp. Sn-Cys]|uniref:TetR/AcrR family transcriptional regulator n=1 Tax=Methylocystis sp. Sn-Cys TaxID=1701263 RepID=UPI001924494F|nr:TetR/AcrR family transcriptional regulator [Methylocystis sp. Sn-Cys]MBL1256115.1 TetR/AcrR family transcriptional regulator [Methylocystis sp. Sn-Cys]
MRKLDPARHDQKRQEILSAARRCFERSGLKGASIAHICKEAGISPGHLYHYFKSKDAIVATLSEAWLDNIGRRFEQLPIEEDGVVPSLVEEISQLVPSGPNARSQLVFEMLAESTRNAGMAKLVQAHSRRLRSILANVLRQGQQRGAIDPALDPETTATIMIAMIDGLKALPLRDPEADRRAVADMLQQTLAAMLKRDAAEKTGEISGRRR